MRRTILEESTSCENRFIEWLQRKWIENQWEEKTCSKRYSINTSQKLKPYRRKIIRTEGVEMKNTVFLFTIKVTTTYFLFRVEMLTSSFVKSDILFIDQLASFPFTGSFIFVYCATHSWKTVYLLLNTTKTSYLLAVKLFRSIPVNQSAKIKYTTWQSL